MLNSYNLCETGSVSHKDLSQFLMLPEGEDFFGYLEVYPFFSQFLMLPEGEDFLVILKFTIFCWIIYCLTLEKTEISLKLYKKYVRKSMLIKNF